MDYGYKMKKFLQKEHAIDILFWSIILIITLINLVNGGFNEFYEYFSKNIGFENLSINVYIIFALYFLVYIIITIVSNLLSSFYITIIYVGVKVSQRKYKSEKVEKVNINNINYYRDIIKKYSPAVLSYLENFTLNEKDIVATLLNLELKRKIKIQEKITIENDDISGLEANEAFILSALKNNNLKNIDMLELTNIVRDDAILDKLLEKRADVKKHVVKIIIITVMLFILALIGTILSAKYLIIKGINNEKTMIIGFAILFLLMVVMIYLPVFIVAYLYNYELLNSFDPNIRNKVGKNLQIKLVGLKKYLCDFSNINEKEKKELVLWEDYLIYSVIFGLNTKIIKEIYSKL